jgi:hypothetical protein
MKKGQVIIEVFMILALTIALIIFIVSIQSEEVKSSTELIRQAQAEIIVKDITRTLDFIYLQGEGAQIELELYFPENFDPERSYIGSPEGPGNIVNVHLSYPDGEMDVQERTEGKVYGKLPEWGGKNKLNFRMLKDVAVLGNPTLLTSPAGINVIVEPEENRTEYTTLSFNGESNIPIELYIVGDNHEWVTPVQKYGGQVDVPLVEFPSSPKPNSDYYRGITLVSGQEIVLGVQINPPRFAEPGAYELEIILEGEDLELTVPLNIELIREYQWLRTSPPSWPTSPWENEHPNYDVGFPVHGKFIICNEHKENKYTEVIVGFDKNVYGIEDDYPVVAPQPTTCAYGNGRWYEYNAESVNLFTVLNNTSVLRYSESAQTHCRQAAAIRFLKSRECTGFQLDIRLDSGTGIGAITDMFKNANNITSFPVNSSVYNVSALTTKISVPVTITTYGRSVAVGSTRIENTAESVLTFDFACNVTANVMPGNITVVDC